MEKCNAYFYVQPLEKMHLFIFLFIFVFKAILQMIVVKTVYDILRYILSNLVQNNNDLRKLL